MALKIYCHRNAIVAVVSFVVMVGCVFCDVAALMDSETVSKWYWVYVTVGFCAIVYGIKKRLYGFVFGKQLIVWVLLLVYCLFRSISSNFVLDFIVFSILLLSIYILSVEYITQNTFREFAMCVGVIALILALVGILQFVVESIHSQNFIIRGSFDNPAGFASVLAFSTPFILYNTSYVKMHLKWGAWIVYLVTLLAIIMSGSRAGLLSALVISCIYLCRRFGITRKKRIILYLFLLLFAGGLYLLKKDSADGRLLIWKCTKAMINDKPWFGHGYKSFEAKYMLYQAGFFEKNIDSKYVVLADDIKHPFNEFLLLFSEFGVIAVALFVVASALLISGYLKRRDFESSIMLLTLLSIAVFSLFSYPFRYPFTWVVFVSCIAYLSRKGVVSIRGRLKMRLARILIIACSAIILSVVIKDMYFNHMWYRVAHGDILGNQSRVMSGYKRLYRYYSHNPYFLYNYAAQLNHVEEFDKSSGMIARCENIMNNYSIQMLAARNNKSLGDFASAENNCLLALRMCPSRFMPLYELFDIYKQNGDETLARKVAEITLIKPWKIHSATVTVIKERMREESEMLNLESMSVDVQRVPQCGIEL